MNLSLTGYAPDIDQTSEGIITDCTAFIPTEKGMQGAPSAIDAGAALLASACVGAVSTRKLDNSFRVFAGTSTKLYEKTAATWTDQTRLVGGNYTLGADNIWRFSQFGDTTLAVSKTEILQFSNSTVFADVTGAPKASIVETVGNFVFLFDTLEATYGDSPNRWWCAAQNNYTDWVPAIATQCATGILVSAPSRVSAAKKFGDQIVAYKERAMYMGSYVGAPQIWSWVQIQGDAGCSSNEAVVNVGTSDSPVHIFMGADDFWRFDGSRPVPLGSPLRKTVFADLYLAYASKIKTLHDRINSRVYFFYPSNNGTGKLDKCVVYHYRENRWGRDDRSIQVVMEYLSGGITWDTIPFSSWDTITSTLTWDSPFWTQGALAPAYFDTSNRLNTLTGAAVNSSFTTGDIGDDNQYSLLSRIKPKWLTKPTSASLSNYYKDSEGDALILDAVTTMSISRFDVLNSSRWHRFKFDMVGDCTLNSYDIDYELDGEE